MIGSTWKPGFRPFGDLAEVFQLLGEVGVGQDMVHVKLFDDLQIRLGAYIGMIDKVGIFESTLSGDPLNDQRHKRRMVYGLTHDEFTGTFITVHNNSLL